MRSTPLTLALVASGLALASATAQDEEIHYTLTVPSDVNGSVTKDPDMETYPAGTIVTLTATPNEGYEFAGWKAETLSGEPETATAFDNLEHTTGDYLTPSGKDRKFAQQFLMNGATALQQVELKLFRIGTVTGSMGVELWNDDGNNDPSEKIAELGTIDDVSTMPTTDTTYTFTKVVEDLDPDGKYWVVSQFEGLTSTLGGLQNNVAWRWSFSAEGSMGTDHAHVLRAQDNGVWSRMTDVFGDPILKFRMRVQTQASPPGEPLELPNENPLTFTTTGNTFVEVIFERDYLLIDEPDHGSVSRDPTLDFYPIGSDVTVTAAPEDGYEFVKWTYGETELTTNPATIRVIEGATLTPVFAKIENPEPLQIDIEHAVAVSWDSQSGKAYQIHASIDMETWEIAVDAIQGTGEWLTQCFIREETEVFYRVEEM